MFQSIDSDVAMVEGEEQLQVGELEQNLEGGIACWPRSK